MPDRFMHFRLDRILLPPQACILRMYRRDCICAFFHANLTLPQPEPGKSWYLRCGFKAVPNAAALEPLPDSQTANDINALLS